MCEPSIIIGATTAVLGGLQSIAGYQQEQAQATYQNQVAEAQYQQQRQAYEASQRAYQEQLQANSDAANRAYQQEQLKLQGEYDKARQQAFVLMQEKLKARGEVFASGRTGKSISLLASDAEREYGRDLANLGTNLGYAQTAYEFGMLDIESQARSANVSAASQRMLEPMRPARISGPSTAGLMLGLGGAALSGYSAYSGLRAPSAGNSNAPRDPLAQLQSYRTTS